MCGDGRSWVHVGSAEVLYSSATFVRVCDMSQFKKIICDHYEKTE